MQTEASKPRKNITRTAKEEKGGPERRRQRQQEQKQKPYPITSIKKPRGVRKKKPIFRTSTWRGKSKRHSGTTGQMIIVRPQEKGEEIRKKKEVTPSRSGDGDLKTQG